MLSRSDSQKNDNNEEFNLINENYNQNLTTTLKTEINESHIINSNFIKSDKNENIENSIGSQVTNYKGTNEYENSDGNQNDSINNEHEKNINENRVNISEGEKNNNFQEKQNNNREKVGDLINKTQKQFQINNIEEKKVINNENNDEINEGNQMNNGNNIKKVINNNINNNNIIINNELNEESLISEIDEDKNNDISYSHLSLEENEIHYPKGIKNLGLSCYMNSLLQCLFNIKELRDYFINELKNKKIDKKTKPISYYFAVVMYELLYSGKDFIIPQYFKNAISKINKLFKKDKPADVSDLFRNLIDSFLT